MGSTPFQRSSRRKWENHTFLHSVCHGVFVPAGVDGLFLMIRKPVFQLTSKLTEYTTVCEKGFALCGPVSFAKVSYPSAAPTPQSPLSYRRFFPGSCPLPPLLFFPGCSRCSVALPAPFATGFRSSKKTNVAVAWAGSSLFWCSEALLLASLRNSSLHDFPPAHPSAFWRKKRKRVPPIVLA